jgi:tetratricopeptide (TPR) repeat protein
LTPDELLRKAQQCVLDEDWAGAVAALEAARKLDPKSVFGAMLAYAYRRTGDLASAEKEYTRELQSDPREPVLLEGRAAVRALRGALADALEDIRAVVALEATTDRLAALADYEEQAGLQERAAEHLRKVCEAEPEHWPYRLRLAILSARLERWVDCEVHAGKASDLMGERPALASERALALSYRGWARFKRGRPDDARTDLDLALTLRAEDAQALCFRALVRAAQDDPGALGDFDAALAADPSDPFAYSVRGEYHLRVRGDKKAALADFRKAMELDPDHAAALNDSVREAQS